MLHRCFIKYIQKNNFKQSCFIFKLLITFKIFVKSNKIAKQNLIKKIINKSEGVMNQ